MTKPAPSRSLFPRAATLTVLAVLACVPGVARAQSLQVLEARWVVVFRQLCERAAKQTRSYEA